MKAVQWLRLILAVLFCGIGLLICLAGLTAPSVLLISAGLFLTGVGAALFAYIPQEENE